MPDARPIQRTVCRVLLCALVLCLGRPHHAQDLATSQPAQSPQARDAGEDLGPMSIEIDLDRLLFDTSRGTVQDAAWQIQAGPGKQILLLPFTVENVNRVNKLSRFPISVRAGRFVGFVVPKPDLNNASNNRDQLNEIIRAAPGDLRRLLFDRVNNDAAPEQDDVNAIEEDAEQATPDTAPRLTRELTISPDGTVQWEVDRSFHAATLKSASEQNPYAYKIDPNQLRAAQPPRPERLARNDGEDSRAYALRKREQQLAEREKQTAYRELRDMLRELPETFSEAMPSVLYAVIEVPADTTLALQGPSPLPWTLSDEKKQLFTQLSQGANAFDAEQGEDVAGKVVTLIDGHPLDARAIAIATTRSKLASQVEADDPGYQVLARLLQSKDIPTRRVALFGVATSTPPTLASAKLIGVAGEAALGEERKMLSFASLGKMFATSLTQPDSARVLVERVSQTIADPQGPAAPQVIEQVLASLSPSQQTGRASVGDDVVAVMIESIDLTGVEKDEQEGVAKAIIAQAPTSPVAAGWLDQHLLASRDRDLVNQTLSLLYESKLVEPVAVGPASGQSIEAEPVQQPIVDPSELQLTGTIAMARPNHALINLFDSNDDLQQAAAWAVLGRFHIALPNADIQQPAGGFEGPGAADEDTSIEPAVVMYNAILAKADARAKMPVSIVDFIVHQQDPALVELANTRLVAMLAQPNLTQKTALAAMQAYADTPQRFTPAIQSLDARAQQELMQTMYRAQDMEAPLMAGLIAGTGSTLTWFNEYLNTQGELPSDAAWAKYAKSQNEGSLLQNAASPEMTIATAGAAALVVAAGGDQQQELAFAQKVALMEDRQASAVTAEWNAQREKIYASAFEKAAGAYRLVAMLSEPNVDRELGQQPDAPDAEQPTKPATRIDLGVVELRVEGVTLSLSVETIQISPVTGQLGIRLNNPASLRSFSKPELSAIPIAQLGQPIDMLQQEGGAWSGETTLLDGRSLTVSLEPAQ